MPFQKLVYESEAKHNDGSYYSWVETSSLIYWGPYSHVFGKNRRIAPAVWNKLVLDLTQANGFEHAVDESIIPSEAVKVLVPITLEEVTVRQTIELAIGMKFPNGCSDAQRRRFDAAFRSLLTTVDDDSQMDIDQD